MHITPSEDDPSTFKTLGGGSVANTIRGLSACFGISSGLVGACGDDEQGKLFIHNMNSKDVDLSRLRTKKEATAQVSKHNNTMYLMYVLFIVYLKF